MAFANRVALITGAAGAIGSATAQRLAREGASLALTDLTPIADIPGVPGCLRLELDVRSIQQVPNDYDAHDLAAHAQSRLTLFNHDGSFDETAATGTAIGVASGVAALPLAVEASRAAPALPALPLGAGVSLVDLHPQASAATTRSCNRIPRVCPILVQC